MWAPAEMFSPALDIFLFPLKRMTTYFYEHLIVLALAVIAVAALIAVVTMVGNWRARRT